MVLLPVGDRIFHFDILRTVPTPHRAALIDNFNSKILLLPILCYELNLGCLHPFGSVANRVFLVNIFLPKDGCTTETCSS
jgi:hypothetical protein